MHLWYIVFLDSTLTCLHGIRKLNWSLRRWCISLTLFILPLPSLWNQMPLLIQRNRFRCRIWQWRNGLWILAKPRWIIYIRRFIYFCLEMSCRTADETGPTRLGLQLLSAVVRLHEWFTRQHIHHHLSGDTCCASWLPNHLIDSNFILVINPIHGKHSFFTSSMR